MKNSRKKLLILAGFSFLALVNLFAANNEKGIEYYRAELFEAAKIFFLQQTNQSPVEQAENYYYLGQIYYELNQADSALFYYRKSIEVLPTFPFGYIGEGRLELKKKNTKVAEELFKKANNYAKKDPSVQTTIAEAYLDLGDYNNVIIALDKARKVNNKYSGIYVVEGDMMMAQGKIGDACGRYENAILFNSTDKVAYLKLAQVYRGINTDVALSNLDRLIAVDPNYIPAYAIIGDIYRDKGIYRRALDAYEKIIRIPGVPLVHRERYAQLLYFDGQYPKALDEIKYVISQDPNNLVMKRLEAYNSFRMENYELGFEQINKFLEIMPEERHIYQDYATLAQLATNLEKPEIALKAFNKTVEIDSEKAAEDEVYKKMATIAYNARMYREAVAYYEKYFEKATSPDALDFYYFGQTNYNAAVYYVTPENMPSGATSEAEATFENTLKNYVKKGDAAYVEVTKRRPNMHIGHVGRAKMNQLLDLYYLNKTGKIEGHAKPLYEEALAFMLANNDDGSKNADIVAAYDYLVSYYGVLNDIPSIIEYSKKIIDIDPNNARARETLTLLKVKY